MGLGKHPPVFWEAISFWNLQSGDPKENDPSSRAPAAGPQPRA